MEKSERNQLRHTYCNPFSIPEIPRGKDDWFKYEHEMFSHENKPADVAGPDYRSISDPTVLYYDNKWYLYPSYGMAWVSEDFERWTYIRTEPYCPKYSPAIIPWKDGFLMTSWNSPLYKADSPLGPFSLMGDFVMPGGDTFVPCDPCLFGDDDGRIYMYAFAGESGEDGKSFKCKIVGYELDRDNPRQVVRGPVTILKMNPEHEWERRGLHHQDASFGWVEGPHLLKHNGRYYMIYAAPDTCDASYCMAVYYTDEEPLGEYKCQKKNPLTFHMGGTVAGAGHGCVEHGPNNSLWAFYTIAAPCLHRYERRIGMDLVAVDENGELYCPFGVTDTPQYIPGYRNDPVTEGNTAGMVSLTGMCRPVVSSYAPGRDGIYATDENNLSWWQPEREDGRPTVECDLSASYMVGAVRLFWRDVGLDYAAGKKPAPVKYVLEGHYNGNWFVLLDMRDNAEEYNIDYRTFPMRKCDKVRLEITGWGKGLEIGLIDFAVFGARDM